MECSFCCDVGWFWFSHSNKNSKINLSFVRLFLCLLCCAFSLFFFLCRKNWRYIWFDSLGKWYPYFLEPFDCLFFVRSNCYLHRFHFMNMLFTSDIFCLFVCWHLCCGFYLNLWLRDLRLFSFEFEIQENKTLLKFKTSTQCKIISNHKGTEDCIIFINLHKFGVFS